MKHILISFLLTLRWTYEIVHRNFFYLVVNISLLYTFSTLDSSEKLYPDFKKWSFFLHASFVEMKTILLSHKQNKHSSGFLIISPFVKIKKKMVSIHSNETMKEMWKQICSCKSELFNLKAANHEIYSWQRTWDTHFFSTCLFCDSKIFLVN